MVGDERSVPGATGSGDENSRATGDTHTELVEARALHRKLQEETRAQGWEPQEETSARGREPQE